MTETKARPSLKKRMALSLIFAMLAGLVLLPLLPLVWTLVVGVMLFGAGWLVHELLLARAPSGLLADPRSAVAARSRGLGTAALAVAGVGLACVAFSWMNAQIYRLESTFVMYFGALGVGATCGLVLLAAAIASGKTRGGKGLDRKLSIGPTFWERLLLHTPGRGIAKASTGSVGVAGVVLMFGAFLVVPAELSLTKALPGLYAALIGREKPTPYYYPRGPAMLLRYRPRDGGMAWFDLMASGLEISWWGGSLGSYDPARNYHRRWMYRSVSVPYDPETRPRLSPLPALRAGFATPYGLKPMAPHLRWMVLRPNIPPFALFGILFIGCAGLSWRQRHLLGKAKTVLAAADPERLAQAARRLPPLSRRSSRRLPAVAGDGFVGSALRHAADLDSSLSPEDKTRLWGALERMSADSTKEGRAARSLEARCILETDRDLQLRFEFLQLAGELETRAAQRWLTESLEASASKGSDA